jgi:hypothetical protein
MVVENRRRAERQFAIWMGSCLVEGEAPEEWQDCGVFDFATLGLGMDLHYTSASDLVGRQMLVCLPVGPSMDVTLTGAVRNAKGGPDGIVRAGVEFIGLSETERGVVELLESGTLHSQVVYRPA